MPSLEDSAPFLEDGCRDARSLWLKIVLGVLAGVYKWYSPSQGMADRWNWPERSLAYVWSVQ